MAGPNQHQPLPSFPHSPRRRPPPPLPTPSTRGQPPADWTAAAYLVDKPPGWTSFDVCAKLRRALRTKKVGHAGTLDPRATGLLIVCVGRAATKAIDSFVALDKEYTGTLRLGEATPSLDGETEVSERAPWHHVSDADLVAAAATLTGDIDQVPPMYSAVSVGGERLYLAARRGEAVERAARRVTVSAFDVERVVVGAAAELMEGKVVEEGAEAAGGNDNDTTNTLPGPHGGRDVSFRVVCSKGTYIRTLAADLGTALGSVAHLTSLRRTRVGAARVEDAWPLDELVAAAEASREAAEAAEAAET